MRGLRVWLRVVPAVAIAVAMAADVPHRLQGQFEDIRGKALAADRAGHWQEAKRFWEQAHALAPDAFQPIEGLAAVAAQLGQADEALAQLDTAYGGSGFDPVYLLADEHYAPLHADPRWDALMTKLQAEWEQASGRGRQRQVDLDPQSAPPFKSYRKLSAAFDRQQRDLGNDRWRLSRADYSTRMLEILKRRVAALHRYLAEHPEAGDRADAAWDAIATQIWPRFVQNIYYRWGEFGTQILEEVDQYLREYPGTPHCGSAAIDRAFVAFGVRPDGGTKGHPWRDEDMRALDRALAETARAYAGTTAGGLALAWRLILADDPSSRADVPELRAMKTEIDEHYGHDRDVQNVLWNYGDAINVLIAGIDAFDATDLASTRWTASSFKGKVTLIDFWATWCGPCVGEIPTIRKAWNAYHDQDFAVLGVSLDSDDRAQFVEWLARNDVGWPQVWDGLGFSTPMAKRYKVHGIPFTILANRDGRVTNVNLRGDALLTRIKELLDASSTPPGENTSSVR